MIKVPGVVLDECHCELPFKRLVLNITSTLVVSYLLFLTSRSKMSLHWTLIAGFLYTEIGVVLLLLIPLVSPRAWNKLFKSRFLKGLENQLIYYFYVLVAILVLFFLGNTN